MNSRALPPLIIALAINPATVQADVTVSFSASDGGRVFANEYGPVIFLASCLKVGGNVVVWIAIAISAFHPHFLTAYLERAAH